MSQRLLFWSATALTALGTSAFAATPDTPADDRSLPTVVVTGTPLSTDPDFLATLVEVVKREDVLTHGGASLADALADVPGVSGSGFAAGASRPVIRGFDANRVRTLEDGIGSFDVADVGPDHGVPIDPLAAQQIEVVRGAATLRYGSQAIGGVVNVLNNRVPLALPAAPVQGEVTGSYGSNADSLDGSGLLDTRIGDFALHVDGFGRRSQDYSIPGGDQENSFVKTDGGAVGTSYFFGPQDRSRVGVAVIHSDSQYGIPSDTTYIDMRQTKALLRSSFALDAGSWKTLTVEGGYGDYQHTENEPDGTVDTTFKIREWDSRVEGVLGAVGPFSGAALGAQVQRKEFSALGEDAGYLFPTTTRSAAGFAFGEMPITSALHLQLGARIEQVRVEGTPASDIPTVRTFTPISGSIGAVYDASDTVRLGLTASSAARAPAQTELFARGGHDGPQTFETGDPGLKTERAQSLEASLRIRQGTLRVDASLWGARIDHFIYGRLTGRTCDDDGVCVADSSQELKELFYSQAQATFLGAEAHVSQGIYEGPLGVVQLQALGDFVRARLEEGGNVPRIPPYHLGLGVNLSHGAWEGAVLGKYTGAQRDVATAETPTGGFFCLDAHVGWQLQRVPATELVLVGHNLTNATRRDAVAFNKDLVVEPGRDVRLLLHASF